MQCFHAWQASHDFRRLEILVCVGKLDQCSIISTWMTPLRLEIISKELQSVSNSLKTWDGSRAELQAVKPTMLANMTVASGNEPAMGSESVL
jgi:hypothetical protein